MEREIIRVVRTLTWLELDDLTDSISTLLRPVKGFVYSITYDNGKEFSGHEQVKAFLGALSAYITNHHWLYFLTDNDRYSHGVA
jgi:IS30 family transposase